MLMNSLEMMNEWKIPVRNETSECLSVSLRNIFAMITLKIEPTGIASIHSFRTRVWNISILLYALLQKPKPRSRAESSDEKFCGWRRQLWADDARKEVVEMTPLLPPTSVEHEAMSSIDRSLVVVDHGYLHLIWLAGWCAPGPLRSPCKP